MENFKLSDIYNPAEKLASVNENLTITSLFSGDKFSLLNLIFFLVGFIFLVSLSMAAFGYVFSQGDPKKISQSNSRFTNSLVGLVVVFTSFVIVKLIASIFGFGEVVPIN